MQQDAIAHPPSRSKMRPHSRASTNSVHSVTTQQQNVDHSGLADLTDMYHSQWQEDHHPNQSSQQALGPEDMLVQALPHMQAASTDYSIGDSMGAHMGHHHLPFDPHQGGMAHHSASQTHGANISWCNDDSQMMGHDDISASQISMDPRNARSGSGKPMKRKSNANNDGEMRDLFYGNRERPLDDVAKDLRGNERGPQAERKRQLYAMLWLNLSCVESKNSIPRGRVYHMYASRCSDDRVMVLNPASFGKLVRVVFPSIKTRRLGVRGESKYHYCHFDLREPPAPEADEAPRNSLPAPDTARQSQAFDFNASTLSNPDIRHSHLPSPEIATDTQTSRSTAPGKLRSRSHSRYNMPQLLGKDQAGHSTSSKTPIRLELMTDEDRSADSAEPVLLPRIQPFLPPNTDPDAAQSLVALYRSQCTSIIESFRYCREKNFFHLYTSFHGTLTMPVQKLFAHSSIAPWIEECDVVLYQRLTRLVVQLSLQAIPKTVINRMHTIASKLVSHIREAFHGQPEHVIRAKTGPATIFAGILDRMLRVNLTAHAVANSMAIGPNRDQMYADWLKTIKPRKIAESVPTRGMDDVARLLGDEMIELLDPNNIPMESDPFGIYSSTQSQYPRPMGGRSGPAHTNQSCVERWRNFLMSLPQKFPYASHADIAWCVERVGTAIMRDLTIFESPSFSSWWVAKTFFDEEVWFLAEVGGFLRTRAIHEEPEESQKVPVQVEDGHGRANTNGTGVEAMDTSQEGVATSASPGQSDRAPFPPKNSQGSAKAANELPEDSGIGIRTPETDLPMEKFTFEGTEHADLDLTTDGVERGSAVAGVI